MDSTTLLEQLELETDYNTKVDILGNLINLLIEERSENAIIYPYLKDWFRYYLISLENKSYRHDTIKNEIVKSKVDILSGEEKLAFIKFIIRGLKEKNYNDYFKYYEKLYEKEELKYLKENHVFKYILRLATTNLLWLSLFFIISIILLSIFLFIIEDSIPKLLIKYSDLMLINYPLSIVSLTFNIQGLNNINTQELLFILFLKGYFFIFITYYLLREISKRIFNE